MMLVVYGRGNLADDTESFETAAAMHTRDYMHLGGLNGLRSWEEAVSILASGPYQGAGPLPCRHGIHNKSGPPEPSLDRIEGNFEWFR